MKAGAVVADIFLECGGGRRERETVAAALRRCDVRGQNQSAG